MKESRLFRMLYLLLEKGHMTAPEFAKEFEVSIRTIYRDMDALSAAGIPIYAETGRNGGIYLQDHFVLDKALLSKEEKEDMLYSLQSLSVVNHVQEKAMLTKLSGVFHMQADPWFEVDFSRWGNHTSDNDTFNLLKQAILQHKECAIVYLNTKGEKRNRVIYPLCMYYKAKEWYVKAYCTRQQEFRLFKFNRMLDVNVLEQTFLPMTYPDDTDVGNTYRCIKLRFDKNIAYRVYDEFNKDNIEEQENGDLVIRAKMPEDEWLIGYLLSFGSMVEVIEPTYVKAILAKEAKKIYECNKP